MKPVKSFYSEMRKQEKIKIENSITKKVFELGLNSQIFSDYLSIIDNVDEYLNVPIDNNLNRLNYEFRVWISRFKDEEFDNSIKNMYIVDDKFSLLPVENLYGTDIFTMKLKNTAEKNIGSEDIVLFTIRNNILYTNNKASITVSQFKSQSIHKDLMMIHPFSSPSLHELLKLLMEWQWCFYNLHSNEPMSIISNDLLISLGLDVRNAGHDPIVDSIMSLPDQQVATFLKQGVSSIGSQSIKCPTLLKAWLIKRGILNILDVEISRLVHMCLKRMSL